MGTVQPRPRIWLASLIAFLLCPSPALAQVQAVFSHSGDLDPALPGWGVTPGDTGSGVTRTAVVGTGVGDDLSAWSIADGSGARYRYQLTPSSRNLGDAAQFGWILRAVLRVPNASDAVDASVIVELSDGRKRWALIWGSDPGGDPIVRIFGFATDYVAIGATFHTYELRYDPGADTVDLYIDGALREAGNPGIPAAGVAPRFNFGSGQSGSTGTGHYHRVEWLINGDSDRDEIGDPFDNCPYVQNNPNLDSGSAGEAGGPDGIGDACQCGDLSLNGIIDAVDVQRYREFLADPTGAALTPDELGRCAVNANPFDCNILSVVVLNQVIVGRLATAALQSCGDVLHFGNFCRDTICREGEGCQNCPEDCGRCPLSEDCVGDSDCASAICELAQCAAPPPFAPTFPPRCGDGVCNGDEVCAGSASTGCPDDCGRCPDFSYCGQDNDCEFGSRCLRAGTCTVSGSLCAEDQDCLDASGDPDDTCDKFAFGSNVYEGFEGICTDGTTFCDTGFYLLGPGLFNTDACPGDHICVEQQICHPVVNECTGPESQIKCCGDPPEFADKCDNGYQCVSDSECKSGICWNFLAPSLFGGTPSLYGVCIANQVPDNYHCLDSSDCSGGICNFGFCRSSVLDDGELCTTDAACASGTCAIICINPVCPDGSCDFFGEHCGISPRSGESVACSADCGLCPVPSFCSVNADCESGFCDPDFSGPGAASCRPCGEANNGSCPNGARCQSGSDCQAGHCLSGYCAPVPPPCSGSNRPNGCSCSSNGNCASNICVDPPGSAPKVCAPTGCTLPAGLCTSDSQCCDFPTVPMTCGFFLVCVAE